MKLAEAVNQCKVYGYVSRTSVPEMKYYKNHHKTIIELVIAEQGDYGLFAHDWECFNPRNNLDEILDINDIEIKFRNDTMPTLLNILKWIQENIDPIDLYKEEQLNHWAINQGYVKTLDK